MFNNNDEFNEGSGNHGNKGKFSERLAKMRRERTKKSNKLSENFIINVGRNIFKVIIALPSVVYSSVKSNKKSDLVDKKNDDGVIKQENSIHEDGLRNLKVKEIRQMNISLLKFKKEIFLKKKEQSTFDDVKLNISENEIRIQTLQKEIIDLIKKKLVENINELEILNSELYLLREINNEDIYLNDCIDDIKEIKKMLSKIKALKEKYDYLKDNIDFEYMLEYNDDLLIDKILELKRLCSDDDIRYTVENYKLLDEYRFLYLKIDKLQENTIKYEEYKAKKVEELKERDIDFEKLKNQVYDVDRENDRYEDFVKKQEAFLRELNDKVSTIDSYESVSYQFKGFNQLLGNSFKYLGLLLLHPLKAFLPGIATHTLITKNTIRNLYNNLEFEENRKMIYQAIDYSDEINRAINNLDLTAKLIDTTLEDIIRLKAEYKKKFSRYEYSFSGYRDAIKKLNKIENAVLGNKIKVAKMQEKMKEKERQNKNKLKLVKKLNSSDNS